MTKKYNHREHHKINIQGKEYPSVSQAAREFGITRSALRYRLQKYGQQSDILNKPLNNSKRGHKFTMHGKTYVSVYQAAKKFNILPQNLTNITRYYGYNADTWPERQQKRLNELLNLGAN